MEGKVIVDINETAYLVTDQKLIALTLEKPDGTIWGLQLGDWVQLKEGEIRPDNTVLFLNGLVDIETIEKKPKEYNKEECLEEENKGERT
jgi:hypothetical protein